MKFPKDNWICDAIAKGYLIVNRDGSIKRAKRASRSGEIDRHAGYSIVTQQTHAKTGRIYFNMKWRGYTKSVLVNRVVALRFLPNPNKLPQVNHIDGNKANNAVENLEWASGSENERHAHRTGLKSGRGSANSNAKLTVSDVLEIRASVDPISDLCARYGVSRSAITNIQKRKTWNHV